MRERNLKLFFDQFMWYLLYTMPLLVMVFMTARSGSLYSLTAVMTDCGLGVLTDNVIYTSLASIFGADGVLPLFASHDVLLYATYFICVFLIHLAVDFLVFIPRLLENLCDKFTKNGGIK